MPLKKGKKNFWRDVEIERKHGKPRKQAEAIAYAVTEPKHHKKKRRKHHLL